VYGPNIIDQIMEAIRNELEKCDNKCHLLLIHSLSGGTGSGISGLLLDKLADKGMYNSKLFQRFL